MIEEADLSGVKLMVWTAVGVTEPKVGDIRHTINSSGHVTLSEPGYLI